MSESNPQPIYSPETPERKNKLVLTSKQADEVCAITLGIEEVDERVREMAVEDVVNTLQNGNPLNRLISDQEGKTTGYIACEDFVPQEAYVKYFGSSGQMGRNLLKEIPAFFDYAKSQGYTKLNFHGWNDRLNHVLEHFGFERLRTDNMGEFNVDFYEKSLGQPKTPEELNHERAQAFEQKYMAKLAKDYEQTLQTFSKENRPTKEQAIAEAYQTLSGRLQSTENFDFNERQQNILKLKLARHFQTTDSLDMSTLYDAIIETPKFLDSDKGKINHLFDIHEQKTLQKIAEIRKSRAEMTGDEAFNPYEALFETSSGKYYMARLLNMPHLKEESAYMDHCVGTSDSYINQIKRGDIEILSFRSKPQVDPDTHQLVGEDRPIMTIEYNLRANTIEQMKKANDAYLKPEDPYFTDAVEALKTLRQTETDLGKKRDFKKIAKSELENIKVKDYCVLTDQGEIPFQDFNYDAGMFILKAGEMRVTPEMDKTDIAKIVRIVESIQVLPDQIALNQTEVTENTKLYIGPFSAQILQQFPKLENYYTSFPEGKISRGEFETTGKTGSQLAVELKNTKFDNANINLYSGAEFMFNSSEFKVAKAGEKIPTVRLQVRALFTDENSHTYAEILVRANQLGLDFLPHETAADLILNEETQPKLGDWFRVVSEPIAGQGGYPNVFSLERRADGLYLYSPWAGPTHEWRADYELLFGLRKLEA